MALINNKWRKDIGDNAANALIRTTGAGVTALMLHKLTEPEFVKKGNINSTIANLAPGAISIVGLLGDFFLSEPKLRAFFQGMATFGLMRTTTQFIAGSGAYMGIEGKAAEADTGVSGMRGVPGIMNGTPGIMNGNPAYTPRLNSYVANKAIANNAATVKASADMTESKANALAGTMIQN